MSGPVGYDVWKQPECLSFVIKNICPKPKRVRVFTYPVDWQGERDLMKIPYVSQADIQASITKGELYEKIKNGELTVSFSNLDLIVFSECAYDFLRSAGIVDGLSAGSGGGSDGYSFPVVFRQAVPLIGTFDGINRIFMIPNSEKFINGSVSSGNASLEHNFKILIRHNGRGLIEGTDYLVAESISGTGYDTLIFTSLIPKTNDNGTLVADYVVLS